MSEDFKTIRRAMDMGQWKHSWHISLQSQEGLRQAKATLQDMVNLRAHQLGKLREAMDLLDKYIEEGTPSLQGETE